MKVTTTSENLLELIAFNANLIPLPLIHTQVYPLIAKAILEAHTLNVFEVFKDNPQSVDQAAVETKLDKNALQSLLRVLTSCGYLTYDDDQYTLTSLSRKWCLKNSSYSLYNMQCYNQVTWNWLDKLQTFLKTGEALQYHDTFDAGQWAAYQKGMESIAVIVSKFVTKVAPTLNKPEKMLDIGGAHGLFSLEFVKKYPTLSATIFDLPLAVDNAEPLLRKRYSGNNIQYRRGDALTDSFGDNEFDIILMASVMHHFTAEQNLLVSKKIFTALKKDGYFIIQEFLRSEDGVKIDMVPSVMDLFFNLSSSSGGWSAKELINFQEASGLKSVAVKKFWSVPGMVQVIAQKK